MKYILLTLTSLFLISKTYSQIFINGTVAGLDNDTIYINVNSLDIINNYTDTVIAANGNFQYSNDLEKPTMIMIQIKSAFEQNKFTGGYYLPHSKRIFVFSSPNDSVCISGKLTKNTIKYSIKSSERINSVICEYHQLNLKSSVEKLKLERMMHPGMNDDSMMQDYNNIRQAIRDYKINYITILS